MPLTAPVEVPDTEERLPPDVQATHFTAPANDTAQTNLVACVGSSQCDDGNACTINFCTKGACTYENAYAVCSDGNACSDNDLCISGACVSTVLDSCDDGNVCTEDACYSDKGCTHTPKNCGDATPCVNYLCFPAAGGCVYQSACDDSNPCTFDYCNGVCNNLKWQDGTACGAGGKLCVNGVCLFK